MKTIINIFLCFAYMFIGFIFVMFYTLSDRVSSLITNKKIKIEYPFCFYIVILSIIIFAVICFSYYGFINNKHYGKYFYTIKICIGIFVSFPVTCLSIYYIDYYLNNKIFIDKDINYTTFILLLYGIIFDFINILVSDYVKFCFRRKCKVCRLVDITYYSDKLAVHKELLKWHKFDNCFSYIQNNKMSLEKGHIFSIYEYDIVKKRIMNKYYYDLSGNVIVKMESEIIDELKKSKYEETINWGN